MSTYELWRLALRALAANKFRAALTMLGLVIGVAAVITVMAVGSGGQSMIASEILKFGTLDSLHLQRDWGKDRQQGIRTDLTVDDVAAVREAFAGRLRNVNALYYVWRPDAKVRYKDSEAANVDTSGVEGEAARLVSNNQLLEGRYITRDDHFNRAMVAVIDETLRDELFGPGGDAIGKEITYGPNTLTVVGVLKTPKGLVYMLGEKGGNLTVPLGVAMMLAGEASSVSALSAQVTDLADREQTIEALMAFLKARHGGLGNYRYEAMDSLVSMFNAVTGVMAAVISAVAAISLLVGGIGIMNIMLVSVTERTREIGLRKAIGARRRDILAQFLCEAVLLSLCGGLLGIAIGTGLTAIGTAAAHAFFPELAFEAPVRWGAVLLSAGISAGIGIFFGFYPAWRASKLSPVEALRYE